MILFSSHPMIWIRLASKPATMRCAVGCTSTAVISPFTGMRKRLKRSTWLLGKLTTFGTFVASHWAKICIWFTSSTASGGNGSDNLTCKPSYDTFLTCYTWCRKAMRNERSLLCFMACMHAAGNAKAVCTECEKKRCVKSWEIRTTRGGLKGMVSQGVFIEGRVSFSAGSWPAWYKSIAT